MHCLLYPKPVILSIANKMLDLLRLRWNEGLEEVIEPFFEQRVLDRVKEAEVDALFTHFLMKCDLQGYDVAGDYWKCVDRIKRGYRDGSHTTLQFYEEVEKNSILKDRFLHSTPDMKLHMSKEIKKVISCEDPEAKYPKLLAQHRRMKITDEEFDEFIILFFRMCSPTPKYLSEVWYNVVKIKTAMMPTTLGVERILKE